MKPLTDEHARILNAIKEDRLFQNKHGRWEISGEIRPDRKSREQLRSRGLIERIYPSTSRWTHWRVTARGEEAFRRWLDERIEARRAVA